MTTTLEENRLAEVRSVNTTLATRAIEEATKLDKMTQAGLFGPDGDDQLEAAIEAKKEMGRRLDWWESLIGPAVTAALTAHKQAVATRDQIKKPLDAAASVVALAAGRYKDARDMARRREEERLRQIELKRIEDERLKAAAEAESRAKVEREEQARKEAEQRKAREEAERLESEGKTAAAAEARLAEDRAREAAEEAKTKAEMATATAEEQITAPIVTTPVVLPDAPKIEDSIDRRTWKFRLVNVDLIPREYMMPDEKAIGGHGRTRKERANIPGVEFYSVRTVS